MRQCSNDNAATGNTINGSDESAIHLDDTCTGASTGNTVTSNKINSACAGILSGPGATGTITSNTFYNVVTLQETGSNTCTPPPGLPNKAVARSHGRIAATRP